MKKTDKMEISVEEYSMLVAKANTLYYLHPTQYGMCPKCGRYILVRGYVCFGCGYDRHSDED